MPTLLRTALHDWHASHGGRLVEFGGWSMPVQYTTIIDEHRAVRERAGLFDIGHMGRLVFSGPDAEALVEKVTTNHVAKLKPGQIQYSLMCNPAGGVIDDVLVYRMSDGGLRMVCNASNRHAVLDQFQAQSGRFEATLDDHTKTTAMIAVQGPKAAEIVASVTDVDLGALKYYRVAEGRFTAGPAVQGHIVVSRTGYTGEDGFEVISAVQLGGLAWDTLLEAGKPFGLAPCGLGARDTLRFEAAMPLYGHEMDAHVNPYAAGLGWAVKLDKGDFVGRDALAAFRDDPGSTRVGLELEGKRIARQGTPVLHDAVEVGTVTSGTFSPTLGKSLAMALVKPVASATGTGVVLDVRGKAEPARVVPLPFYKRS
ncbi:MAG: glycine cleavage system aminomethyltransferase GcvT [Isosphaeraceae bacterium]